MNQDPFKKEHHLRQRLDEYHVDIPDFPIKPNKLERVLFTLAAPTRNPLEPIISGSNGVLIVQVVPIIIAAIMTFLPLLF